MAGLGILIMWGGYSVMYYGITQVQGGNWGLLDLVVPGWWAKAAATPKDSQSSQASAQAAVNGVTASTVGTAQQDASASTGPTQAATGIGTGVTAPATTPTSSQPIPIWSDPLGQVAPGSYVP